MYSVMLLLLFSIFCYYINLVHVEIHVTHLYLLITLTFFQGIWDHFSHPGFQMLTPGLQKSLALLGSLSSSCLQSSPWISLDRRKAVSPPLTAALRPLIIFVLSLIVWGDALHEGIWGAHILASRSVIGCLTISKSTTNIKLGIPQWRKKALHTCTYFVVGINCTIIIYQAPTRCPRNLTCTCPPVFKCSKLSSELVANEHLANDCLPQYQWMEC